MCSTEDDLYAKDFSSDEEDDSVCEEPSKDVIEKAIQELRAWIKTQPHFVNCRLDDEFLIRFLRMRRFSVPRAQVVLDKYLTMRTRYPNCYQNLDVEDPGIRDLISRGYIFPLPERDPEGRVVIFSIAGALDALRHKQTDVFRAFTLTYEALLEDEENQRKGLTYIFTQEGYQISHALLVGLRDMQKMVSNGEKAIPMRHKLLHWINLPKYLKALFELLKTFLSEKLQKQIVVHDDLTSLEEYFPARILPKEYGGILPLSEMTAQWIDVLDSKRERMLALDEMGIDESKRPKDKSTTNSHIIPRLVNSLTGMEIY